jgi:endonuclease/exonuclease/phosphatase family metal-dependent hydrolase
MIAEIVKTFRIFSRPLRRQFWWPDRKTPSTEQPGVVLVSLDDLKEWERRPLLKVLSHYKHQPLADQVLPEDHLDEHLDHDPRWASGYRMVFFFIKTCTSLPRLILGRTTLAQHLCESDDLARLHTRVLNGKCFSHIGTLHTKRVRTIRRIKSFLSGLERRPYELWVVVRDRKMAFLPAHLPLPDEPLTIAEIVDMARRRPFLEPDAPTAKRASRSAGVLRVMSYNIHSGIGLDGRLSVRRLAEVLHQYDPDFVALQEIDVGCKRSGQRNQLEALRELWPSEGSFFPLVRMRGGHYGIGFLSRLPVTNEVPQILPPANQLMPQEARGLQKVTLALPNGSEIDIFNTHLGLTPKERRAQLKALLKHQIGSSRYQVLAGDFNCKPSSREYRSIARSWQPTQEKPEKTWFGTFPVRHLDYCFYRGDLEVVQTIVPRDSLTRIASDHLPLITDFKLP